MKQYQAEGVSLWLNGRPSNPKEIAKACRIAENGIYMRDYVPDGKGGIEELKFDYVKLENFGNK